MYSGSFTSMMASVVYGAVIDRQYIGADYMP